MASLQRLQSAIKRAGLARVEQSINTAQSLLVGPLFSKALATHNRLQEVWPHDNPPRPITHQAQSLARDVSMELVFLFFLIGSTKRCLLFSGNMLG